ncbi:MAG: 30S ribosome-binding factor RbfA [Bacilli bacterium]
MKVRNERIALQIQREASDVIHQHVKDPEIGFVTVTGVEVSNDVAHAKIFVSIMGSEEQKQTSMNALERARGFIRSEIGARIRLRITPELHFKLDESMDYSAKIGRVLSEILPVADKGEHGDG